MADTADLGSVAARCVGSSPILGISLAEHCKKCSVFLYQ